MLMSIFFKTHIHIQIDKNYGYLLGVLNGPQANGSNELIHDFELD